MAGFSKAYFIGATGGYMGSDGLTRPFVMLLHGQGSREWLEAVYQDDNMRPMAGLRTLIPERPDDPNTLLDAAIVFLSPLFEECPSFSMVAAQLEGTEVLDFDLGSSVPKEWQQLREEALPLFREMNVFEGELRAVDVAQFRP